jgi:hypothetical protein
MTSPLSIQCNNMYSPILQKCKVSKSTTTTLCLLHCFPVFCHADNFYVSENLTTRFISIFVLPSTGGNSPANQHAVWKIIHLYNICYTLYIFIRKQYTKIYTATARTFAKAQWMKHNPFILYVLMRRSNVSFQEFLDYIRLYYITFTYFFGSVRKHLAWAN